MKTIKLVCVTTDNHNKFYNMTENGDGTFLAEYGRINASAQRKVYPMAKWDSIYAQKTGKGYRDVTSLYIEDTQTVAKTATTTPFDSLLERLHKYAKKIVDANYRISSRAVTKSMIAEAQKLIDELVELSKTSLKAKDYAQKAARFNEVLISLFQSLPRKMSKVQEFVLDESVSYTKDELYHEMNRVIRREQTLLDALETTASVASDSQTEKTSGQSMPEMLGLEMKEKDADLESTVLSMLGEIKDKYVNCWYVTNTATQKRFDDNLKTKKGVHKTVKLFWHGSRNENWLSILQNGMLIRPSGVATVGAMFGEALYFADKARKSFGYTSAKNSYWARGTADRAFMAIFSVNTGKHHNVYHHTSECYSFDKDYLQKKGGYDSVYAHDGADLRNDEFVVYDPAQVTIHALVELRA